jgi:hypothetical protein
MKLKIYESTIHQGGSNILTHNEHLGLSYSLGNEFKSSWFSGWAVHTCKLQNTDEQESPKYASLLGIARNTCAGP